MSRAPTNGDVNWSTLRPNWTCSNHTTASYVWAVKAVQSCHSDATKTLAPQRKPELVPKKISHKRPGMHAHQTNTLREMTRLVRQPTVDSTAVPRLARDGRDGCRMREAEWMKPAKESYLQAEQSISTVVSSARDATGH